MKSTYSHLTLGRLTREIELIETNFAHCDDLEWMIDLLDDPVQTSLFRGLLKIKRDIGDIPLEDYLKHNQQKARRHLFDDP